MLLNLTFCCGDITFMNIYNILQLSCICYESEKQKQPSCKKRPVPTPRKSLLKVLRLAVVIHVECSIMEYNVFVYVIFFMFSVITVSM